MRRAMGGRRLRASTDANRNRIIAHIGVESYLAKHFRAHWSHVTIDRSSPMSMNLTASLDDLIKEDKGPRGKERGGGGAVRRERGRERSAPYVRPGGRDRPAAPTEASAMSVFVGNMSWETDWKMLKDHMRAAGDVAHVKVIERADGRSRGCVARAARSPCTACLSHRHGAPSPSQLRDCHVCGRQVRRPRHPHHGRHRARRAHHQREA